eukprot:2573561-Prymnesium_polylepis.1
MFHELSVFCPWRCAAYHSPLAAARTWLVGDSTMQSAGLFEHGTSASQTINKSRRQYAARLVDPAEDGCSAHSLHLAF